MNSPTDAGRLIPYLNREQYGDRPLIRGPYYNSSPIDYKSEDRYGRVGDHYEVVDHKYTPSIDLRMKDYYPYGPYRSQDFV